VILIVPGAVILIMRCAFWRKTVAAEWKDASDPRAGAGRSAEIAVALLSAMILITVVAVILIVTVARGRLASDSGRPAFALRVCRAGKGEARQNDGCHDRCASA
jgi:hypothetical protein